MDDACWVGVARAATIVVCFESDVQPIVIYRLVSGDDNIITLTDGHEEALADGWLNRDHVGRNDREVMSHKGNREGVIHACVDQTKQVFLAWGKG
jgi:hypothetical protein